MYDLKGIISEPSYWGGGDGFFVTYFTICGELLGNSVILIEHRQQ